jgi:hypothetical protein
MLSQRILPPHRRARSCFGPTTNTSIRLKGSYLSLLRRDGRQGHSFPSSQSFPAQERTGPAGTDGPVSPSPGDRSHRVQSRGQPGEQGERLLSRLTHCKGRVHLPHDPIQDRQPGVPAGADEKIPNRHPDVLVEQLGCGIHQPEKKIVSS